VQATRAATLAWNSITRKEGESVAHSFTVPSSMDTLNMRSDVDYVVYNGKHNAIKELHKCWALATNKQRRERNMIAKS
jgi:hypothetical protein